MAEGYDLKKEWPKIKKELQKLSVEAKKLVKKGEGEITRFSRKGKLHIDATTLGLKKEHLYHLIGKEYVRTADQNTPSAKLKKMVQEVAAIDKQILALKRQIKVGPAKKRPKKVVKKKAKTAAVKKKAKAVSP